MATTSVDGAADQVPLIEETSLRGARLLNDFIQRRDQESFAQLVGLYGPLVFGVCRRVVGNHHDAEDAFQATFLILSQKAVSIKRGEILAGWLYRVAHHVSLRARSGINKRHKKEKPMSEGHGPLAVEPGIWGELEPILDQELSRLSEKLRLPILMCDLGGSTLKEAAMELGCPESTLSSRLTKARSLLALRLTKHGFTLSAGALVVLFSRNVASAAAIPDTLLASTLHTAGAMSFGQAIPAGEVSSKAAALAQGAMKSLFAANVKLAVAAVAVLTTAILALNQHRDADKVEIAHPPAPAVVDIAKPADEVSLPAAVRQALEENAAQLNPITIAYTTQKRSRLPDEETFRRLNISKGSNPQSLFFALPVRVIWQDQKFYMWSEQTIGEGGGLSQDVRRNEQSFDGTVLYDGYLHERQAERNELFLIRNANLNLRGTDAAARLCSTGYFRGFTGLSFPPCETARMSELRAESFVLSSLHRGGKLASIENVRVDERPLVKVDVVVENPEKAQADKTDLEELKNPSSKAVQIILTPEERAWSVKNVLLARKLPATKHRVFYLDPELHYAVRRTEEFCDPATLLLRCDCSDFQQISERQLWLPRKYEIHYHSYATVPGVVFDEPFLSEVTLVHELSGDRVPDDQFVLNYSQPGVTVIDESAPATIGQSGRATQASVHYMTGNTPEETSKNKAAAIQTGSSRSTNPIADSTQNKMPFANRSQSAVGWFSLAGGVAFLLAGAFLAYRRFAK